MASDSDPRRIADGLPGEWLGLDEVLQLALFAGRDRDFRIKLHNNFGVTPKAPARTPEAGTPARSEPAIKAAVRRRYASGAMICEAGAYGSTAFLLLEGSAVAELPQTATPRQIAGRSTGSLAKLAALFRRRRHVAPIGDPGALEVGEVSAFASMHCERPPPYRTLGPGDLFGIDTCVNFYPREATVRAVSDCVVLELLRSALDTIRACGDGGDQVAVIYRDGAIRNQLAMSALFRSLSDADGEQLASACELLTPESEGIRDSVIYSEGMPADALYLVRSGNIKLSQHGADGEIVLSYLGRGAAFGFEGVVVAEESTLWQLLCTSHPERFASLEITDQRMLGRAKSCDVIFPADERSIGRQHCRLQRRGDDVYLEQGATSSVTLLNGEPVTDSLLRAGDRIGIGPYTFTLQAVPRSVGQVATPLRRTTARGLDQFEIIRVPDAAMQRLLHDTRVQAATATAARALAVSPVLAPPPPSPGMVDDLVNLNLYNSQNVLLIDLDRCTRCDECVRACADAHDGVARFTRDGPRLGKYLVTMACRSCTDPQCMIGCPVGSIHRLDSLEIRIEDWCIGCQSCAKNCPFGNINMVDLSATPTPLATTVDARTPAMRATVCDLCAGYDGPSCVYACPHDAAIRVNPAAFLTAADKA